MPRGPIPSKDSSGLSTIAAIALSLLAVAPAAAGCSKPAPETKTTEPQYSEQQVADAKKNLCDAYDTIYRAVERAGTTTSEDPNQKYMISISTRLAFNTAADYLMAVVEKSPAGPPVLVDATVKLANSYRKVILAQIADAGREKLDPIYSEIDSADAGVKAGCE